MSKSAEILSEYLVKIGFVDDEEGRKATQKGLEKLETALGKLAKRTVLAGASFAGMVVAMGNKLGGVEQQAQRMNTTAGAVRGLTQGFKNLGLEASAAQGQISSLWDKLSGSQGKAFERYLKDSFGVETRDADGKMRDLSKIYLDIIKASQGGGNVARERLKYLGFDQETANAAINGELLPAILKAQEAQNELSRDYDRQASEAKALKEQWNSFSNTLDLITQNMLNEATPAMTRALGMAERGIKEIGKALEGEIRPIANSIVDWFSGAEEKVERVANQERWQKWLSFVLPDSIFHPELLNSEVGLLADPKFKGERNNNPGNIRDLKIGDFAVYKDPLTGLGAMAYQLGRYNNVGLNTISKIISTWAPSNENNTEAYIKHVSELLGVGKDDVLDLKNPAEMARLMKAMVRHENTRNIYSDGMYQLASLVGAQTKDRFRRDKWNYNSNATINITVNGASDPKATAALVEEKAKGVIADSQAQMRAELGRYSASLSFSGGTD